MASFVDLPVNVMFNTMQYCNSAEDTYSLLTTQLGALKHFLANRNRFITPCVQDLKSRYGSVLSSQFILAARLRHIRQQKDFHHSTIEEAEKLIRPVFDNCMQNRYRYDLNLARLSISALNALSLVGRDADCVVTSLSEQDLRPKIHREWRPKDGPFVIVTTAYHNAVFHFEAYCQLFFRKQDLLFKTHPEMRPLMFQRSFRYHMGEWGTNKQEPLLLTKDKTIYDFYSALCYVHDQHCSMVLDVIEHFDQVCQQSSADLAMKMRLSGAEDPSRSQQQMNRYIHYLTSQGLGMLLKLRNRKIEERTLFVLSTFYTVSQCPDTLIKKHEGMYSIEPCEECDEVAIRLETAPPQNRAGVRKVIGAFESDNWVSWIYLNRFVSWEQEDEQDSDGWQCSDEWQWVKRCVQGG
ncbi:hypothetical protein FGRMN_5240 [Fusarium graminum]|nr:hypothetical protein FGRMN_5240 [Fusarium graminum]